MLKRLFKNATFLGVNLIFLNFIASCSSLPVSVDLQKEIANGAKDQFFRKEKHESVEDWKTLTDVELTKYVTRVGNKVSKSQPNLSLDYILVDTQLIQAVSSAGTIYVTRGMLNSIENEAELACLLGHEVYHEIQNQKETPQNNSLYQKSKDHLPNLTPSELEGFGIESDLKDISYSNYSKSKEREADEQGSLLCKTAGYNAYALSDLQNRIANAIKANGIDWLKNLKGSHDQMIDRSQHLKEWLADQNIQSAHQLSFSTPYLSAVNAKGSSQLTRAQKKTLNTLDQIKKQVQLQNKNQKKLSIEELENIKRDLFRIIKEEKITDEEIKNAFHLDLEGDTFMSEKVLSLFNRSRSYREQVVLAIAQILADSLKNMMKNCLEAYRPDMTLNEQEKDWIISHPMIAYDVYNQALKAESIADNYFPRKNDLVGNDDENDAFRHFLWAGLVTQELNANVAKKYLWLHEILPPDASENGKRSTQMDLFNNQIGIDTALELKNKNKLNTDNLEKEGLRLLNEKKLKVIVPNRKVSEPNE